MERITQTRAQRAAEKRATVEEKRLHLQYLQQMEEMYDLAQEVRAYAPDLVCMIDTRIPETCDTPYQFEPLEHTGNS